MTLQIHYKDDSQDSFKQIFMYKTYLVSVTVIQHMQICSAMFACISKRK